MVARLGGNPYLVDTVRPVMLASGWPPDEGVSGFMHPFWSLAIFCPVSLLPYPIAVAFWELFLALLIIGSVILLANNQIQREFNLPTHIALLSFSTILFPPTFSTFMHGQTSGILLAGCVGWLSLFMHQRFFLSGLALSLTTLKPQLFIPFYLWIFISQFRARDVKVLLGFGVGLGAQIGIALVFAPQTALNWIHAASTISTQVVELPTPALPRILQSLLPMPGVQTIFMAACSLASLVISLVLKGRVANRAITLFLPFGFLMTPYTWSHSFLPLLVPYLGCVAYSAAKNERATLWGSILFATFGVFEMVRPAGMAAYMVVIPLSIFIFGIVTCNNNPRQIDLIASEKLT